jgi:hypothetical protein
VSRQDSQQRWIKKTGNGAYHSGPEHVARVKAWREANPGYWRKQEVADGSPQMSADAQIGLREMLRDFALQDTCVALQDSWNPQLVALLGILAWLRGSALQETIAEDLREIMLTGYAILEELSPSASPDPLRRNHQPD